MPEPLFVLKRTVCEKCGQPSPLFYTIKGKDYCPICRKTLLPVETKGGVESERERRELIEEGAGP
jgi:uncharacterized Zn finger protein (UPF0148 family)